MDILYRLTQGNEDRYPFIKGYGDFIGVLLDNHDRPLKLKRFRGAKRDENYQIVQRDGTVWHILGPDIQDSFRPSLSQCKLAENMMDRANDILSGHGVEAIRGNSDVRYFFDTVALYVNMGDTYETTILFDVNKFKFLIWCFGDWVEKYEKEYGIN